MMNLLMVLQNFKVISGMGEEESAVCLPLCSNAFAELTRRLRDKQKIEQHKELIWHTAACMAYYRYMLMKGAEGETLSFSAGDIRISKSELNSRIQMAHRICEEALASIAYLLEDADFLFKAGNAT